jgi:hypothetical protein
VTTTEENLATFVMSNSSIKTATGGRIAYNHVPQDDETPYIFFQQQGADNDVALDDLQTTPNRPRYAIECWADNPADAIALKNLIQPHLNCYRGTFGDTTVKGIFAKDADDEYVPNGAGDDDGLHGVALIAEVVL